MINEVKYIKFIYYNTDDRRAYAKGEIPQNKWSEFLSLFPLTTEEKNPEKWQNFAIVDIGLVSEKQIKMIVYKTDYGKAVNEKGAFKIGEKYYRSGSDIEFRNFFRSLIMEKRE